MRMVGRSWMLQTKWHRKQIVHADLKIRHDGTGGANVVFYTNPNVPAGSINIYGLGFWINVPNDLQAIFEVFGNFLIDLDGESKVH